MVIFSTKNNKNYTVNNRHDEKFEPSTVFVIKSIFVYPIFIEFRESDLFMNLSIISLKILFSKFRKTNKKITF